MDELKGAISLVHFGCKSNLHVTLQNLGKRPDSRSQECRLQASIYFYNKMGKLVDNLIDWIKVFQITRNQCTCI